MSKILMNTIRFYREKWLGVMSDVLSAMEDFKCESHEEVFFGEETCNRLKSPACALLDYLREIFLLWYLIFIKFKQFGELFASL